VNQPRHWLSLACVCALLALPLSLAAHGPNVLVGDVEVARAIQAWPSPALDNLAIGLTVIGRSWPGETLIATSIVVALLAVGARREAVFVAAAALAGTINALTKLIVASPRPTADLVQIIQAANGLGFPSGHAFGATLLYGSIWVVLPAVVSNKVTCRVLRGTAILTAIGICWSRIRLGAHWPSDVVGGVLWGLVVLSLLAAIYQHGLPRISRVSPWWNFCVPTRE
jgi:membrane-associated phospholipid phosphatase